MEVLTRSEVIKVVSKIVNSEDVQLHVFSLEPFESDKGIGYLGVSKRLKILYSLCNKEETKEIVLFAKCLPREDTFHSYFIQECRCFIKETTFYNEIWPAVSQYSLLKPVPGFIFSNQKLILLEDLSLKKYSVTEQFDLDLCKLVLERLADFHGAGLVYEENVGKSLISLWPNEFGFLYFNATEGSAGYGHWRTGLKAFKVFLAACYPDLLPNVRNAMLLYFEELPRHYLPSKTFRNVLTHNDLWGSNLLFKDHSNVCLIDFQLYHYSPPTFDILTMLHMNTSKGFRDTNLSNLLSHYHASLCTTLAASGTHGAAYTREALSESLKEVYPSALVSCFLWAHFALLPRSVSEVVFKSEDQLKKFFFDDRGSIVLNALKIDSNYKNKLMEITDDLIEFIIHPNKLCVK